MLSYKSKLLFLSGVNIILFLIIVSLPFFVIYQERKSKNTPITDSISDKNTYTQEANTISKQEKIQALQEKVPPLNTPSSSLSSNKKANLLAQTNIDHEKNAQQLATILEVLQMIDEEKSQKNNSLKRE